MAKLLKILNCLLLFRTFCNYSLTFHMISMEYVVSYHFLYCLSIIRIKLLTLYKLVHDFNKLILDKEVPMFPSVVNILSHCHLQLLAGIKHFQLYKDKLDKDI